MVAAVATIVLPMSAVVTGIGVFLLGQAIAPLSRRRRTQPVSTQQSTEQTDESARLGLDDSEAQPDTVVSSPISSTFRHYRQLELQRIVASLKANAPLLIVGREGYNKP